MAGKSKYQEIYELVREIPYGRVATYGWIAKTVGGCTARMAGYAMAAVKDEQTPWHRVINSKGEISGRTSGHGDSIQRKLLEDEGVEFDLKGRIDLSVYHWAGPANDGCHEKR